MSIFDDIVSGADRLRRGEDALNERRERLVDAGVPS